MDSENLLQSEYGNKRPFTVPENYFSELSSRVMAQMPAEEQGHEALTQKPQRALMRRLRPLAVAAMTIGVVLIGFLFQMMILNRQLIISWWMRMICMPIWQEIDGRW